MNQKSATYKNGKCIKLPCFRGVGRELVGVDPTHRVSGSSHAWDVYGRSAAPIVCSDLKRFEEIEVMVWQPNEEVHAPQHETSPASRSLELRGEAHAIEGGYDSR